MNKISSQPSFAARVNIKIDESCYSKFSKLNLLKITEALPVFAKKIKELPLTDTVHININNYAISGNRVNQHNLPVGSNKGDDFLHQVRCHFDKDQCGLTTVTESLNQFNNWLSVHLTSKEKAKETLAKTAEQINTDSFTEYFQERVNSK